jgi:hypothetical protein
MADNLKQALLECNNTCKQLTDLLQEENDCLQARKDIKIIEENVKTKKHLTIQLEKFVGVIKINFESMRTQQEFIKDLKIFKSLMEVYKTLVTKKCHVTAFSLYSNKYGFNIITKTNTKTSGKNI